MTSTRQRHPPASPSSSLYPPSSTSSFPFGSPSSASTSTSASSSSSSSTAGPSSPLPTPPLLRLNGIPISAPSAAAYPPPSPRSSRSRSAMSSHSHSRKSSSSGSSGNATLGPAGYGKKGRSSSHSHSHSHSRKGKGRASRTAIRRKNAMPNPVLSPFDFLSWLRWRWSVWVQATFSVGMLTDWETVLLSIVTFLLALVILYALFFQFPVTVRMVIRRASYYLYGSNAGAAPGAEPDAFVGSIEAMQ